MASRMVEETERGIEVSARGRLAIAKNFDSMIGDLQNVLDAHKEKGSEPFIDLLDISNNRLTADQYGTLFNTLKAGGARVYRFHMSGMSTFNDVALANVVDHIKSCNNETAPMELDISDCAITSDGFADLLACIDEQALYPVQEAATGEKIPLHLRAENNFIDDGHIQEYLDTGILRAYSQKSSVGARLATDETHRIDFIIAGFGQKEAQAKVPNVTRPASAALSPAAIETTEAKGMGRGVKRTICKFWLEGKCDKGDTCTWAHGEEEFGEPAPFDDAATAAPAVSSRLYAKGGAPKGAFSYGGYAGKGSTFAGKGFKGAVPFKGSFASVGKGAPALAALGMGVGVKRTICKFWLEGRCEKGDDCTFAHGESEFGAPAPIDSYQGARAAPPRPVPYQPAPAASRPLAPWETKKLAAGIGPAAGVKRTICKFWLEGKCNKDPCTFAHGEEEFGTPAPFEDASPRHIQASAPLAGGPPEKVSALKRTICKFWLEGTCKKDDGSCTWAHGDAEIGTATEVPRESKPCKFFLQGHCREGTACPFPHATSTPVLGFKRRRLD